MAASSCSCFYGRDTKPILFTNCSILIVPSPFVRTSAMFSCVGTYSTWMSPARTFSCSQSSLTCRCRSHPSPRRCINAMPDVESLFMTMFTCTPSSSSRVLVNTASTAPTFIATTSDSQELCAIAT